MKEVKMVFDINEDLRKKIGIIAKVKDVTVKSIMVTLVEQYIEDNKEYLPKNQ